MARFLLSVCSFNFESLYNIYLRSFLFRCAYQRKCKTGTGAFFSYSRGLYRSNCLVVFPGLFCKPVQKEDQTPVNCQSEYGCWNCCNCYRGNCSVKCLYPAETLVYQSFRLLSKKQFHSFHGCPDQPFGGSGLFALLK